MSPVAWEVEFTDQFEDWWVSLTDREQESIVAAVEFLEERGPALGRPFVDSIKSSRHANMKELPVADDLYDEHLAQLAEEGWTG